MRTPDTSRIAIAAAILLLWLSFNYLSPNAFHHELLVAKPTSLELEPVRMASEQKFIGATFAVCSGLGNRMFRIASLYALGKRLGREPFLNASMSCTAAWVREFQNVFPHMAAHLHFAVPTESLVRRVQFGNDCCLQDDALTLPENAPEPFLVVSGNYLQSVKYFQARYHEVRDMYQFSVPLRREVDLAARKLFAQDRFHKMCVHIRRGDFLRDQMLESRAEFVEPAVGTVRRLLRQQGVQNASLVLLGTDAVFAQTLNFSHTPFHAVYRPSMPSRGADMAFGARHCQSLLLSASASTFGFWMGYLMREDAPVFYNRQTFKNGTSSKDRHLDDAFPTAWMRLVQDPVTHAVSLDSS